MLNQTPIWKFFLVLLVIGASALYALPNLYCEDHSIQISAGRIAQVTENKTTRIQSLFTNN